jgi:hypothetical protein
MEAQFIIALITPGIPAPRRAGEPIRDNTQNFALRVLHYWLANTDTKDPKNPAQALSVRWIDPTN